LKEVERGRHVAHRGQKIWENLKLKDTIKEPGTDKVIILKVILETTIQGYELDLSGSGEEPESNFLKMVINIRVL
jgi:hypothetical protein